MNDNSQPTIRAGLAASFVVRAYNAGYRVHAFCEEFARGWRNVQRNAST
jgi:hypothetical protein